MKRDVSVLQLLVFLFAHARAEPPPECAPGGHSVLQEPYRSATFSSSWLQQSSVHELICDHSLTAGWYQFQLFHKPASMPTHCVQVNHCGTQAPVWLSLGEGETLPGPGEVRQLSACAAWHLYPSTSTDCCMFRLPVTVRHCGNFYVYLLQPTQGCMAYCAQEVPPPAPSSVLIAPESRGNSVYLRCSFHSGSNSSVGFMVSWSRLSALGLREELKQETTLHTSALIELDGFNLRLGDKIYCSSSSFFLDSPEIHSPSVESAEFFAGIRLRAAQSRVSEDGRLYELLVESTVPVPCLKEKDSSPHDCTLSLDISTSSQDEEQLGSDVSLSSCAVELGVGPCAEGVCSQALLHFSPVTDFILDGNRTTNISVKPIATDNFLWNGYTPESTQITVTDVPSAYCYVFTDPHTVTFDGRSYENYQIGTFVLYRSVAWAVEVHVRQWECGSVEHAASCVCGFVLRDGHDVVSFDMCDGELGETKPQLSVKNKGLNKSSLRITESYQGRKITMSLSSGAFVRADVSSWGMSLTLRAPGADRGHTQGLCGTYDGQTHNDFHSAEGALLPDEHSFISAWRLPPGKSLFDSVPSSPPTTTSPRKFCHCQTTPPPTPHRAQTPLTSDPCSHLGNVRLSSLIPTLDVTAEYISSVELLKTHPLHPNKAQSLSQSHLEDFTYFFPEDHEPAPRQPDSPPAWPTHSGLSEEQARAQCRGTLVNSSIAQGCARLLQKSTLDQAVEMCVSDLQLKDEDSWLNGTLPLLENECERRLVEQRRREDYPEVLAILRCPSLCSGNGQCSEWGCVCFPGFGSYDCSSLSDQIPEISELERSGVCDVRQADCSRVRVFGHGFRDSYQLKCEFVQEKFVDGEWVLDEPRLVLASFLDVTALECQLPLEDRRLPAVSQQPTAAEANRAVSRWQIRVSNDGYSYSNAKIVTLYDGRCHICNAGTELLCTLREKTCFISGVCYGEGEISPISPCLSCLPDSSPHTWSSAHKNQPPVFQSLPPLLRSFSGDSLEYQLQALDPEGSALVFSLVSGPDGASVSPGGLLTWRTSNSEGDAHTIRVSVSDRCAAQSTAQIQVSVLPCSCLNGGTCVPSPLLPRSTGVYVCACPRGFRGGRCDEDIDDCKPNPCRYGRCIDAPGSFSCICPAGMTGHTCREDVDECLSQPCFPGVGCNNTLGSFTCGHCPPGFSGDGRNCTQENISGGALFPSRPKSSRPLSPSPCSRRPCHPGVQCFESVHVSAGYVCGPCPHGLHGNGRICRRTNQRTVPGGADGPPHVITHNPPPPTSSSLLRKQPDRRARPKDRTTERNQTTDLSPAVHRGQPRGTQLTPDPGAGERGGACEEGTCFPGVPCEPTAAGLYKCSSCPHGYAGDGVTCQAVCKYPCGRNMECSLPNTCTCKEGYTGYSCHIAVCRPDCKNQGRCVRPSVCECPLGYIGPTCEEAHCDPPCLHGGICAARNHCTCPYGYVGPRCEIMVCSRHCENGGECVSPDVCRCKTGWQGPTCASALCDPLCANGGTCIKPNSCVCPSGFYGAHCHIALCNPPCKNGGQCIRNNMCSCPEGYTGRRCQRSVCEPMCMNRAKCVGPNTCSCASGWSGDRCSKPVCLQRCKNGGECIGPNTCQCPAGWEGLQCQSPVCKQACLNGGRCVLPDYCHCRKGFKGLTCAIKARDTRHTLQLATLSAVLFRFHQEIRKNKPRKHEERRICGVKNE
ncbi:von Willebrand factor D and EGF domain-containing protein [Boleophthalmus pectinirostris]|uniref:von Willebrand factor D and EGF domain-containing protein n=1 Tax=Boleophthalmus pectinirostris TaxID=150288 RepID=UPI0024312E61|nr:von Willebrand factor D and EGF domain-containing protein [Boleophthalmus pectinirostris]